MEEAEEAKRRAELGLGKAKKKKGDDGDPGSPAFKASIPRMTVRILWMFFYKFCSIRTVFLCATELIKEF